MKVAYILKQTWHQRFSFYLILPQLEQNNHGVEVVGMFFFDENAHVLRKEMK